MIVTLDVTLAAEESVTLATSARERLRRPEGNEVEEVEDPPNSPGQGDSVTLRLAGLRRTRRRAAAAFAAFRAASVRTLGTFALLSPHDSRVRARAYARMRA